MAGAVYNDYVYTSSDHGLNWVKQNGSGQHNWTTMSVSLDGSKWFAGGLDYMYYSTNNAVTWNRVNNTPALNAWWNSIATSYDGSKIAAVTNVPSSYIYLSNDSGTTWATSTNLSASKWSSVAMSNDGRRIVAVDNVSGNGYIHVSSDFGSTWTTITQSGVGDTNGSGNWRSISCSSDCMTIIATAANQINLSTNGGLTWTSPSMPTYVSWMSSYASSNGNRIASIYNGAGTGIYTYYISPIKPTVTVQSASSVGVSNATLNGTVSVDRTASSSIRGFNYGLTTAYGSTASSTGVYGVGVFTQSLSGLQIGTTYHYQAFAINSVGTATSSDQTFVTGSTVPGIPTSVSASAGNGQANISFTAPLSNGGMSILYYIASSSPGNITATSTGSPIMITGLTNGTAYTFAVMAVNANGTSTPSSSSNSVTPVGFPATLQPTFTSVTANSIVASSTITLTGGSNATTVGFNYGTTTSYGLATSSVGSFGLGQFSKSLNNLTCNTVYHVQAFA